MMRFLLLLVFTVLMVNVSCSQRAMQDMDDSTNVFPNTVRITAKVKSVSSQSAIVIVEKVIGTGQGVIGTLGSGQEIVVSLPDSKTKLSAGQVIQGDLKEKLGIDASQSSYVLVQHKQVKRNGN